MRRYVLLSFLLGFSMLSLHANNIQVTNVSFTGEIGDPIYEVFCDIAWENSWRTSTFESNYDAAWVFVKVRGDFDNIWYHAPIVGVTGGGGNAEFIIPDDNRGFFIQRSANGIGDISFTDLVIDWELVFTFFPDEKIDVCVYAIEMVYIPEGPFEVGDGANGFQAGNTGDPFLITSEASLTLGGTSLSNLSDAEDETPPDDFNLSTTQFLPAAFPKGFQAFYIMKYELSQGQYAAFLNAISEDLAEELYDDCCYDENNFSVKLSGLPSRYMADAPERACIRVGWIDLATYADWSGLRPMSELEFEKACRGTAPAKPDEYAWGDNTVHWDYYEIESFGQPDEHIINPGTGIGNCYFQDTKYGSGPARGGIFAASFESPSRQEAGASFYGVMELSGNVDELVISTGSLEGRQFDGSIHGDGSMFSIGVASWPSFVEDGDWGIGSGRRGGSISDGGLSTGTDEIPELRVSHRSTVNSRSSGYEGDGGRFVRSDF